MMKTFLARYRIGRVPAPAILAVAAVMVLGGCDLGVFDPGQIEDADLLDRRAINPMIAGVEGEFAYATTGERPGGTFGAVAFLTDEIVHSGQFVGMRDWSNAGHIGNGVAETSSRWAFASRARWSAEEAIRRITQILENDGQAPAADLNMARVTTWAGFTNRVLGDTFCDAVIDGGPRQPTSAFYERAENHFTNAIAIGGAAGADSLVTAAYAGRAQVRMMLGNWPGAVADAARVPIGYVHETRHSENSSRENNGLHNLFMRDTQASVWGTPFAEWGTITNAAQVEQHRGSLEGVPATEGDPRVRYHVSLVTTGATARYVIGGDTRRPNWEPRKYEFRESNVPVAKGTEMRLIEAEAALVGGDWGAAISKINEVRTHRGLGAVAGTSADEAWQLLMKERGIELWLEGRRAADLRRWAQTPGSVPFTVVRLENSGNPPLTDERRNVLEFRDASNNALPLGQGLCLPISENEVNSNPNL
ncbi:MAG: RagB/SusD family nutrient uptake outer membrane protein [Gemmatimonadetes bacterium]|nr:RagB/SusD family nutrient uptake outer membrane protein [Gemmatimonadota bacterium]